jgi:predicted DNA binding CopG/RHH family protein
MGGAGLSSMISDLTEIVTWWQERKATLLQASDSSRKTERTTFHLEQRWIEAIRRQADLDGLTYTQIVNEAFRQYFEGKTNMTCTFSNPS